MQEFILQLSSCCFQELFCDCAGQTYFFFTPTLSNNYVAAKDTSQLKMLYGYPEGKYCQYLSQRSLRYEAKNKKKNKKTKTQRFNQSLVVI